MTNKKISEREHNILKRTISLILAMLVGVGGIPLTKTQKVHAAASSPGFKYFAAKSDWSQADLTDDNKSIKINLGAVPSNISGVNSQPTDEGLTVGDPIAWWVVGGNANNANLCCAQPLCRAIYCSECKEYNQNYGTYEGSISGTLNANHYGASDIRNNILKSLHNTLFKSRENSLIKESTINCRDAKSAITYTVTDKLYLPSAGSERQNMDYGFQIAHVPDNNGSMNHTVPGAKMGSVK